MDNRLTRWRLVVGRGLEENFSLPNCNERWMQADRALEILYNDSQGGLADSVPYIASWLKDIRSLFPVATVAFLQQEAIERYGWHRLITEPEILNKLEHNVDLVATLLALKDLVPEEAKAPVRKVVSDVVQELRQKFAIRTRQAVVGALTRHTNSPFPSIRGLDVQKTIRCNLRHFRPELGTIVPERVYFWGKALREAQWQVILLVDQSASMASSLIYSSVMGSIFASLPVLRTELILFDTTVVDLTEHLTDPVDLLFGIQLGGGTDIRQALAYAQSKISEPERTLLILLTDLFDSGEEAGVLSQLDELYQCRVKLLCLLSLNDRGSASYNLPLAQKVANLGIPTFATTPDQLFEYVEKVLSGANL